MRTIAALFLFLAGFAMPRSFSSIAEAARAGDVAAIRELKANGHDPNAPSGVNGWTPLLHAIHTNQPASVRALLAAGADPNRAGSDGMTPLMMAAGYGYADIVRTLIARGADVRRRDEGSDTALDYALSGMTDVDRFTFFSCQDAAVRALVRAGARDAHASATTWSRMKRCESVALLR